MKPWNHDSHVTACPECDGFHYIASSKQPTVDDPYPQKECEFCDAEHGPECKVCGFTQQVRGYDCLVCDTIAALCEADLRKLDIDEFAHALRRAQGLALADYERMVA